MVFLDVVVIAVLAGLLLGGRLAALADLQLRGTWLAFTALGLQAVAFPLQLFPWRTPTYLARPLWLLSYALLVGMLAWNRRVRGAAVVGLGLALNVAAILANGGLMPVRAAALRAEGRFYHVHQNSIQAAHPHLGWLVDRWAVPHWLPFGNVYSAGDALIAVGIAVAIVTTMRAGRALSTPVPAG